MTKLTSKEQEDILQKLREKFETYNVVHIGYNLYEVQVSYIKNIDGQSVSLTKAKLVDEAGNMIQLENEYNNIFIFNAGVAVVCTRDRFTQERKDGLIDVKGKEILPCIYDKISVKSDGHMEITKGDQKRWTGVNEVTSGNFNWDDAILSNF
jgi:hypothetical protein